MFKKIKSKISNIINFILKSNLNIDKEYSLVLENIIYSPKHKQKVALLRVAMNNAYLLHTAEDILNSNNIKLHLHPNDLLEINNLNLEINYKNNNSAMNSSYIKQENYDGQICISKLESCNNYNFNLYKDDLSDVDLNKLFTLSKKEIARLLEARGFHKAIEIKKQITTLKKSNINKNITKIKRIK